MIDFGEITEYLPTDQLAEMIDTVPAHEHGWCGRVRVRGRNLHVRRWIKTDDAFPDLFRLEGPEDPNNPKSLFTTIKFGTSAEIAQILRDMARS